MTEEQPGIEGMINEEIESLPPEGSEPIEVKAEGTVETAAAPEKDGEEDKELLN